MEDLPFSERTMMQLPKPAPVKETVVF